MFETITGLIPIDPDYSDRTRILGILGRVLNGTLYDVLPYQFHEERGAGGEYIPLRNRRPSVRYNLSRIVVEDSVSLLFSEGHFPTVECADPEAREVLADVIKECRLNQVMIQAALQGAIGSTAILLRILDGRFFFEVLDTAFLTPVWDPKAPDTLVRVVEAYKVKGSVLAASGYDLDDLDTDYWFQRIWDTSAETWFVPVPVREGTPSVADLERTTIHDLGFVPIAWVRNLPGPSATGDPNDGACTFRAAIETQIEIDYQLSQAGRGLKYSSDPTLLIKEPASTDSEIVKGAGNALVVSEKGDARLLEIGGTACSAVLDYVRALRELALESIHGNRSSADRLTAAQSGRALELMNQGLIWLADNLRVSYGEGALLSICRMILKAAALAPVRVSGREVRVADPDVRLGLTWPRWYPLTADDRQKDAQTLAILAQAGQISRETALKAIAATYDIEDIPGELAKIASDQGTTTSEGIANV
ncbi:MAG TPA: phage portal protein [Acetobacteraceae bacterium]|nr:phage portal protein [Acetobacteraceae bacterium]